MVEVVLCPVVVEVVRQSDVLVGRLGRLVVVVVSQVSPVVVDGATLVVVVDGGKSGRSEQPPVTATRARATSARDSARMRRGQEARFIR